MSTSPSAYSPAEIEKRWYTEWESKGLFRPAADPTRSPFTIVIPPPNVTGILHMGHALNNTLQDALVRFRRMQGRAALWVPGTDHAGIATQNVVERQLSLEKVTRHQLGREEFVKRVWAWRQQYGSTIVRQLRRLGSSCDWSRERFTMDEGLSRAVETAFLTLHEKGLIYRGYYLVNWCPRCQTALADDEVQHEEVKGHLWYIRYPINSPPVPETPIRYQVPKGPLVPGTESVVVATTRPETLLGDVAVAVHPEDERYASLKGKTLLLPILHRPLRVIQDREVDREFGTGAVKVTPAHDPTDFQFGQRYDLEAIRVIAPDGRMSEQAGSYAGLDRFECRKRIVRDLEEAGLLVKTELYTTSVGHCYRCRTVIEPTLSPQWFVRMRPLAALGIEAVEKDGLRFVPERWTKVYLDWMRNIRDWCISRQIWWGHRIPVWYCRACYPAYLKQQEQGKLSGSLEMDPARAGIDVGRGAPAKCRSCVGSDLVQDEDVLDTWFSSWLWPFSTLGWPDKEAPDLKRFYPTSVLVTAQDIIFFWVARMVMAGKFFMGKIPFQDVYIHGIIRVEGGKKMSKSLGNIIDPLEIIERMGADALRFSIAHMTSEGQDLYLSESKFLLGRNFTNKLWNAARLILEGASEDRYLVPKVPGTDLEPPTLADRWIRSRLQGAIRGATRALEEYRFNEAARLLYQFVWHDFCDWYLEVAKLQRDEGEGQTRSTDRVLRETLETTLRLLHPIMPFITEELWQKLKSVPGTEGHSGTRYRSTEGRASISLAAWPAPDSKLEDPQAEEAFGLLQGAITEVRNIRSTFQVPLKEKVELLVRAPAGVEVLSRHERMIHRLGSVERLVLWSRPDRPAGSVAAHLGEWDLIVPLAGLIDLEKEKQRIQKEMEGLRARAAAKRIRLEDAAFRSRAPADVVAEEEESLKELERELAKWNESLRQLQ